MTVHHFVRKVEKDQMGESVKHPPGRDTVGLREANKIREYAQSPGRSLAVTATDAGHWTRRIEYACCILYRTRTVRY